MTALESIRRHAHLLGEVAWRTITVDKTIAEVSARHYDLVTGILDRHWSGNRPQPLSVLEIACYAHTTGYRLRETRGARVTLFEISAKLLEQGRALAGYPPDSDNPRLVAGDFHDLPFEDQSFDFVLISSALHHTWDWRTVLGEIQRVLAPGGLLVLEQEPCRRDLCFYEFRVNRVEDFTPFEKKLDELGVIRTFAEPSLGSRPESLFGIVENLEIPLAELLAAVDEKTEIVDVHLIPEDCMSPLDHSWVGKAGLGHAALAREIERDLKAARRAALDHLDPVSRGLGYRLPDESRIEPFARSAGAKLAALKGAPGSFAFRRGLSELFGATLRIVGRRKGERQNVAEGRFRRACERTNGVYCGFSEEAAPILMDQRSLLPEIQAADPQALAAHFPESCWSRLVCDKGIVSLRLSTSPGVIHLPSWSGEGILVLRFSSGVPPAGHARVSVRSQDREVFAFDVWRPESFLSTIEIPDGAGPEARQLEVRCEAVDERGAGSPLGHTLSIPHAGLYAVHPELSRRPC
jgi:ubiquinone/menaquinone biosynthesis C-methylase UbiE